MAEQKLRERKKMMVSESFQELSDHQKARKRQKMKKWEGQIFQNGDGLVENEEFVINLDVEGDEGENTETEDGADVEEELSEDIEKMEGDGENGVDEAEKRDSGC